MNNKWIKGAVNYFLHTFILFLLIIVPSIGQVVPFYPVEFFFNPCGFTNSLPGNKPELYSSFSSVKVVLDKDLPSTEKLSNTISFVGNLELFHSISRSRDYTPMLLNPVIRTQIFAGDVFTPGLELNGNLEFLPGVDDSGNIYNVKNYRFRIRPFSYFIVTPNLIFKQIATFGISKNSGSTRKAFGSNVVYTDTIDTIIGTDTITGKKATNSTDYQMISEDYNIIRYDATFIYLTGFNTRIFLVPYCFNNRFYDLPARSADGSPDINNPKLRERGFGFALGFRYSTFSWGYIEAAFEYERNRDLIYDANSYTKLKIGTKWENQYFTERFGYFLMFDWIRHISKNFATGFPEGSDFTGVLGQLEIRGDIMAILNINRNVSVRPEFDLIYKKMSEDRIFKKFRYWMHLHVLF